MELAGQARRGRGLARSGVAAAAFLARRGARGRGRRPQAGGRARGGGAEAAEQGVRLELGAHRRGDLHRRDLVVVSPGRALGPAGAAGGARARGVPVMAELELGFQHLRGTVAAVTGTKGKSTTTAALGRDAARGGRATCAWAATSARPLTGPRRGLDRRRPSSCSRSRASSSRAPTTFRPQRGGLPEPLRRPPRPPPELRGLRAGQGAHLRATRPRRTGRSSTRTTRRCWRWRAQRARAPLPFRVARRRRSRERRRGVLRRTATRACAATGATRRSSALADVAAARARTCAADLLAAAAAAAPAGRARRRRSPAPCAASRGVEHVLERVAEIDGVAFFNDSKATNVDAGAQEPRGVRPAGRR